MLFLPVMIAVSNETEPTREFHTLTEEERGNVVGMAETFVDTESATTRLLIAAACVALCYYDRLEQCSNEQLAEVSEELSNQLGLEYTRAGIRRAITTITRTETPNDLVRAEHPDTVAYCEDINKVCIRHTGQAHPERWPKLTYDALASTIAQVLRERDTEDTERYINRMITELIDFRNLSIQRHGLLHEKVLTRLEQLRNPVTNEEPTTPSDPIEVEPEPVMPEEPIEPEPLLAEIRSVIQRATDTLLTHVANGRFASETMHPRMLVSTCLHYAEQYEVEPTPAQWVEICNEVASNLGISLEDPDWATLSQVAEPHHVEPSYVAPEPPKIPAPKVSVEPPSEPKTALVPEPDDHFASLRDALGMENSEYTSLEDLRNQALRVAQIRRAVAAADVIREVLIITRNTEFSRHDDVLHLVQAVFEQIDSKYSNSNSLSTACYSLRRKLDKWSPRDERIDYSTDYSDSENAALTSSFQAVGKRSISQINKLLREVVISCTALGVCGIEQQDAIARFVAGGHYVSVSERRFRSALLLHRSEVQEWLTQNGFDAIAEKLEPPPADVSKQESVVNKATRSKHRTVSKKEATKPLSIGELFESEEEFNKIVETSFDAVTLRGETGLAGIVREVVVAGLRHGCTKHQPLVYVATAVLKRLDMPANPSLFSNILSMAASKARSLAVLEGQTDSLNTKTLVENAAQRAMKVRGIRNPQSLLREVIIASAENGMFEKEEIIALAFSIAEQEKFSRATLGSFQRAWPKQAHCVYSWLQQHDQLPADVEVPDPTEKVVLPKESGSSDGSVSDIPEYGDPDTEAEWRAAGYVPEAPTQAKPGSEERVVAMAARYASGVPLWLPGDKYDFSPEPSSPDETPSFFDDDELGD